MSARDRPVSRYEPLETDYEDPWPLIASERSRCPVAYNEVGGFWQALSYDAVESVLRRPNTFSNAHGTIPQDLEQVNYKREKFLPFVDPPDHTRQRRLLVQAFSPKRVGEMSEGIRQIVDDVIDALPSEGGDFEVISTIAAPLPVAVICQMMGAPREDWGRIRDWSVNAEQAAAVKRPTPEQLQTNDDFSAYIGELVRARRTSPNPPDDLSTALSLAELDGVRFTDAQCVDGLVLMMSAGNSTTAHLISNLVWLLESNPEQKALFLSDMDRYAMGAVEEGLRCEGTIQGLFRHALEDTEVEGVPIAAGEWMWCGFGPASHDPEVFEDPEAFRIDREWDEHQSHMGFSHGVHHCLGSNLARMETAAAITGLYRRLPGLRARAGFVPKQLPGMLVRGWYEVEMVYEGPVGPRLTASPRGR